jgi:xylulose-5-phosphate/fructose-6-phosphate phosphoketolase
MAQMSQDRLHQFQLYRRAANSLGTAQISLKANALLQEPLKPDHLKPCLLGHWGTQPGLNLIYAHVNRLMQDTDAGVRQGLAALREVVEAALAKG